MLLEDLVQDDPVQADLARTDPARLDLARTDPARLDLARTDPVQVDLGLLGPRVRITSLPTAMVMSTAGPTRAGSSGHVMAGLTGGPLLHPVHHAHPPAVRVPAGEVPTWIAITMPVSGVRVEPTISRGLEAPAADAAAADDAKG